MCHVSSNQLSLSSFTIFSDACAIDDGEAVVLTGSQDDASMNKVMMYTMKGQAITLPSLITGRYGHACGKVSKIDGETVNYCFPLPTIHNLLNPMQLYVVTGGIHRNSKTRTRFGLASTEILKKGWGHSWQRAASLPSNRIFPRGVSLANGHFMVSGEEL